MDGMREKRVTECWVMVTLPHDVVEWNTVHGTKEPHFESMTKIIFVLLLFGHNTMFKQWSDFLK